MAKILGESGRYVSDEAMRRKNREALVAVAMVAVGVFIEGLIVSTFLPASWLSLPVGLVLLVVTCCCVWFVNKLAHRKWSELEKDRKTTARGASGEILVSQTLEDLPDTFCVFNDLVTPHGNLDHVVVGPTGVFIMDAKAWRGVVASDDRGELLLNGQPTEKPYIRQFIQRVLGVRQKIQLLAPGTDLRFEAAFVFTAAWVGAKWGTTSHVKCIALDRLLDFIIEKDYGQRLNPEEVTRISQAFLQLSHLDPHAGRPTPSAKPAVTPAAKPAAPATKPTAPPTTTPRTAPKTSPMPSQ